VQKLLVENLHKRFGDNEVLKGVSLAANAGDVTCIIGSSGSGKSTLLRCINLLEQPNQGRITLNGEVMQLVPDKNGALKAADPKQLQRLRSRLAMVFQHFNLWAHMTALENVIEAPVHVLGQSKAEATERAEQLLNRVGVASRKHMYPAHLSGGEQQRVAIARALMNDPPLILADEPTGNLDSVAGDSIMELLVELHAQGRTIVLVTHDEYVASYAARELLLRDGMLASDRALPPRTPRG
jgi:arginine/ornithine transport system ATP-binding protein